VELSLACMEKWFERNSIQVGPASLNPLITCNSILEIGNWLVICIVQLALKFGVDCKSRVHGFDQ